MDGITLCKKLKTDVRTSHIPVILLTAKDGIENKMAGIGVGADDYIGKPFHLDYLLLRTKMLISQREKLRMLYADNEKIVPFKISSNSVDEIFLNDLLQIIESQIDNPDFSIQLLAEMIELNKTNLSKKIKAITGQTTSAFIRNTRLKKAAILLQEGSLNVSEIMYSVGFTHPSYFSRSFKELFGVVPTEYKSTK